jgi:hypothetical protein
MQVSATWNAEAEKDLGIILLANLPRKQLAAPDSIRVGFLLVLLAFIAHLATNAKEESFVYEDCLALSWEEQFRVGFFAGRLPRPLRIWWS